MSIPSRLSLLTNEPSRQKIRDIVLLGLLVAALYLPSLFNGFVWDDYFVVVTNDFVHSWANIPLLFTRQYLTQPGDMSLAGMKLIGSGELSYRPVVTLSYFLDWAIWKENPFGYHLHNFLLHLFNTLLVYILLSILTRCRWGAFGGALLFAWHPVHTETVCAIGNREDVQFFFFTMAALLCYIAEGYVSGQKKPILRICSLGCFFLALFAKEMALTLPVILWVYDSFYRWDQRWPGYRAIFNGRYAGYWLIVVFYIFIRFFVITQSLGPRDLWLGNNIYTHALILIKIIGHYLFWLILPFGWHHIIPEDNSFAAYSFFEGPVLVSFIAIIGLVIVALFSRRRNPGLSFSIAWFFITLAPVMNFFPLRTFAALRYLYLPSVALSLAVGLALSRVLKPQGIGLPKQGKMIVSVFAVLILVCYAGQVLQGIAMWKNDISFGRHLAQHYPAIPRIRCILGTYYQDLGQDDKAYEEFAATLRLDPGYGKAYLCRGMIHLKRGKLDRAQADMERALDLDARLWQAHFNLGQIYMRQNRNSDAIEQFSRLLRFAPRQVAAYNNLGVLYFRKGDLSMAEKMWGRAIEIDPDNPFTLERLKELSERERRVQ